jgi:hypothetical protein
MLRETYPKTSPPAMYPTSIPGPLVLADSNPTVPASSRFDSLHGLSIDVNIGAFSLTTSCSHGGDGGDDPNSHIG